MSDYFKFCPKCGRVLYGDFCSHCEPEKERAYRRKQQKLDDSMFEDYSRKHGLGRRFSKRETKSFEWGQSETEYTEWEKADTAYSKWDSKGKKQTQKKKQGEKNSDKPGKIFGVIIFVIFGLISIGGDLISEFDINWKNPISSIVNQLEKEFGAVETIQEDSFFDGFSGNTNSNGDTIDMEYQEDVDYTYTVDDEECGYDSIPRFYLYDEDENVIDTKVQQKWDALYKEYENEAMAMLSDGTEKARVSVNGYVTYLDDDYANLVVEYEKENLYTGRTERKIYSYVIDMDTMEEVPISDFLDADQITISDYLEDAGLTATQADQKAKDGDYYFAIGEDGNVWIGAIVDDGQEQNIKQTFTDNYVN